MNLDILFVNIGGSEKKVYQDLSKEFSACEPPFWTILTAGYVRKQGCSVDFLDAAALNMDFDETISVIKQKNPRLLGIDVHGQQANCSSPLMVATEEFTKKVKAELPEQPICISGWHPSALPERSLRDTGADYLIQGEGFRVWADLGSGKDVENIPGLWRNIEGEIIRPRSLSENIRDLTTELDQVAWDLVPWKEGKYRAFNWMCLADFSKRQHYVSLYTSLGCPYSCSFCAIQSKYGERKIRYWSPEWVLRQLDILVREYGICHVNLVDDLFIFNPDHYMPIAQGLLEREYKLNICAFARVDAVDRMPVEKLDLLKKAGFNWFKLGIESPVKKVMVNVNKNQYAKDDIRRVVKKIHDAGIDMCANFIFGLPGDDYDSMEENFEFSMELNPVFPSFFCAMAVPGSQLYEDALKNGIELPETWLGYAQQGYDFLPLPTEFLTAAQVLEFRDYAFTAYYDNPRYLHMIETKFNKEAREHIESMNSIRLKRKLLGD